MTLASGLFSILVFPGLLYAVPMAWLMLWITRKLIARLQSRIGPPFYQPFFDFVKLMSKTPVPRPPADAMLLTGLPLLSVGCLLGALALLPVFARSGAGLGAGFSGDLILLVTLLEVPPLCAVLAGFASRSIFGQVGATREAVLSIAANVPFLTAIVALSAAAGSWSLEKIALQPVTPVNLLAALALLLTLPVKLRLNPFSLANAEQEIYAGPNTEFEGPRLALWELSHGLEFVALAGLVASLGLPWRIGLWPVDAAIFVALSLAVVVVLAVVSAATGRHKVQQASRFYYRWGLGISALALAVAMLMPVWRG